METNLNYIKVTPNITMTAMMTEETNELIRPYLYSNMSCIVLPEELIFINCGTHADIALKFRNDMETKTKKKTSHLILTSKSWDIIWGMGAFKDVTVVSSSATKAGIRTNLKRGIDASYREWIIRQVPEDNELHESLMKNEIFVPTTGFSKNKVLGPDTYPIKLGATLAGAISIYCPSDKVLFSGNVIQSFMPPLIWPITGVNLYRKWEELEIDKIIPGRGPVIGKEYLILIRKWMEAHLDKLREYRNQDIPERLILKQEYPDHPGKSRKSWIEGGPYHTESVERITRYWYKQILKEVQQEDGDLMFIS
ncbi:MAG: hypothetical protein ACXADY_23235 [Candidatus Hodarchaeales archaeon]|jgi:glyoxylase-like metal-dependent hydrolase (beta-lactamase superfamily II)